MHTRSMFAVSVAALVAACHTGAVTGRSAVTVTGSTNDSPKAHDHVAPAYGAPLPLEQLAAARRATTRYQDYRLALREGYVDIGVELPNMGRHLLKESLLDATFDPEHPELLVYMEDLGTNMKLVAVEYAVPLSLAVTPPEGFTGGADTWFADERFKLWTLHAWVFRENPDGVFHPTNQPVP
jgi:hypothetical protein